MKKCFKCGFDNQDTNIICANCGNRFDMQPQPMMPQQPIPSAQQPPMPIIPPPPRPIPVMPPLPPQVKKEFTIFDVLAILGFVASICGTFWCSIILLPLAFVCSILGFVKGTRFRGLAVAGIIISAIAGIAQLVYVLYKANLIPKWFYSGLFS